MQHRKTILLGIWLSDGGRRKVAELLLDFVKTDSTAKAWFSR